jgi:UTP--glucose-1-phosphate uridylyltransferase
MMSEPIINFGRLPGFASCFTLLCRTSLKYIIRASSPNAEFFFETIVPIFPARECKHMAKIRKAVITAAGKGTRQYPASHTVQKELFPIVDSDGYTKPVLQTIVEEALSSGIEEVCIVVNPTNHDAVKAHFQGLTAGQKTAFANKPWGIALSDRLEEMRERLTFVVQEKQDGYGHAVFQAKSFVGDEPFMLLLGDHVYVSPNIRCTIQVSEQYDLFACPVSSVFLVKEDLVHRYGIVATETIDGNAVASRITAMVEKPSVDEARSLLKSPTAPVGSYYSFFGIHALPPAIFDCLKYLIDNDLRNKGEIQFTSAQEILLRESDRYIALCVEGKRYDIGVPDGLVETMVALALYSPYARKIYETVADVERQKLAAAKV